MSIKRGIIVLTTGLAVGTGIFWAVDYYAHLGLVKRITWTDVVAWQNFAAGFITASWLVLWSKFLGLIFKPKKKETAATAKSFVPPATKAPATELTQPTPARMTVQNGAVLSVAPANAPATPTTPVTSAPIRPTEPSQKVQDIEMLCKLEPDLDMMSFKHVNLEGRNIDLVYSSDTNALLCTIFSEPHSWTVNTSVSIEESTWTDENGNSIQPCLLLLRQAAALEKMEPNSILTPTIILMRGSILNYAEAIPYLKDNHITVVTYQPSDMSNVDVITNLLKQQFTPFPPSYDVVQENMNNTDESTQASGDTDNG